MLPLYVPRPVSEGSMIYIPQGPNVVAADVEKRLEDDPDAKGLSEEALAELG